MSHRGTAGQERQGNYYLPAMDRHARNKASFDAVCKLKNKGHDGADMRTMVSTLGQSWKDPRAAFAACRTTDWKHMPIRVLVHMRRAIQFAHDEANKVRAARVWN